MSLRSQSHVPRAVLHTKDQEIPSQFTNLQTDEQRLVLDTVAQVRKCGLESILSLPQLVVCGDQSAGKSSTLEALTEIPFPRNDNLCTRFATEISLRLGGHEDTVTVRVIPDDNRPQNEKQSIEAFAESITDLSELPRVMDKAMVVMGIVSEDGSDTPAPMRAFARDVLSIEIEGPSRPQLTLVDIPGLIHTSTKGVSDADVALVAEITEHYISQPRTICLAVVSAGNDVANQTILTKVRQVDPQGDRTLGIITKPDMPPSGSGLQNAFLELARNENVFLKLGWHVLRNRKFEESANSLLERNQAEATFFRSSNFKSLPKESVGIDTLRARLSVLLFEHIKRELPKLRRDLEEALREAQRERELLGAPRSSNEECRAYLAQLSLHYYEHCKAAVNGFYEGSFFHFDSGEEFSSKSDTAVTRLRAVIQQLNTEFAKTFRLRGHKFQVDTSDESPTQHAPTRSDDDSPIKLSKEQAIEWVRKALIRTRGKELVGNFNPLLIGELFWEQSSGWKQLAVDHIEEVSRTCERFLGILLSAKAAKEVRSRLFSSRIGEALKGRRQAAYRELDLILKDNRSFPINYNHYYTDTISKRRQERQKASLAQALDYGTEHRMLPGCQSDHTSAEVDIEQVIATFTELVEPDMENFSCEDALDCLFAIYKALQKTFVTNMTTQVIERHIVHGLEDIFSPIVVNSMSNVEVEAIASEPLPTRSLRDFLNDRINKLEAGKETFRVMMGATMK
ncbi:interferon-induced GTP-binding protein Mx [Nemania sp. NC0429]|nr:interferon-induced GTP-binding protein Mx [Nemania sp. NC0429]